MSSIPSRRDFIRHGGAALAACSLAGPHSLLHAQPAAPFRILCTAPGGSIPDIVARRYAEQLGTRRIGPVVVDNRPGAAGRIAVAALKQADPDGSTMLLAQGAVATVYPYLYPTLAYDAIADLKPVSMAAETTLALSVGPMVPERVTTVREFVEWTKDHPALANYASPGVGTLPHLVSALLARQAKVDWQHVAYQGGPAALVDLMGGRLAAMTLPEGLLRQHHAAGKLRVLATSGAVRSEFMPGVPTFVEQGYPELVLREWFAFFMPGATPLSAVERAAKDIRDAAAAGGAVSGALREMAMLATASSPAELVARIATEQKYWQRVVALTGVRAE